MHAQTVDTRPLFPPPTWPGYEATHMPAIVTLSESVFVRLITESLSLCDVLSTLFPR